MIEKTQAIVLRTVKYSESSVICKMYTRVFGMQSYMINGVRTGKSKSKAPLLQPMNLLLLEAYHREQKNLQRIKEFSVEKIYNHLSVDVMRSAVGLFLCEVILQSIKEEESNEVLFDFLHRQFLLLDETTTALTFFPQQFLLQLSRYLGFYPSGNFSETTTCFSFEEGQFVSSLNYLQPGISGNEAKLLSELMNDELPATLNEGRRKLLHSLLQYFQMHISDFGKIKSLAVLEEVLHA